MMTRQELSGLYHDGLDGPVSGALVRAYMGAPTAWNPPAEDAAEVDRLWDAAVIAGHVATELRQQAQALALAADLAYRVAKRAEADYDAEEGRLRAAVAWAALTGGVYDRKPCGPACGAFAGSDEAWRRYFSRKPRPAFIVGPPPLKSEVTSSGSDGSDALAGLEREVDQLYGFIDATDATVSEALTAVGRFPGKPAGFPDRVDALAQAVKELSAEVNALRDRAAGLAPGVTDALADWGYPPAQCTCNQPTRFGYCPVHEGCRA